MGFEIETKAVEDRCYNFGRLDGTFDWISADFVAFADDATTFDAAAGEGDGPALRPVIASASGIDFWGAAKFGKAGYESGVERAALEEVFKKRAVALIVHRCDNVFHAFDGGERLGAMNVPGDFVEDGNERVDGDETNTGFNKATRQQTALTEAGHAVALANFLGLFGEIESFASFFAGHQAVGGGEISVHELGAGAGFEIFDDAIDDLAEFAPALETDFADFRRRKQIGDFEIFLGWIGVQDERVVGFAQKTGVLAMRHVAAGRAHGFGKNDVCREFVATAFKKFERASGMRGVDAAGEKPAGLHHLMASIVDCGSGVITGADEREFVGEFGVERKDFRYLNVGIVGFDRLEGPADFGRRIRLHVESIDLAGCAEIEDQDAGFIVLTGSRSAERLERREFRKAQAEGSERADLEEVAAGDAVASGDRASSSYFKHGFVRSRLRHVSSFESEIYLVVARK